jgi:hypothetical protein
MQSASFAACDSGKTVKDESASVFLPKTPPAELAVFI